MISIENVTKVYGKTETLRDVSLTIHKGEIFGLIGPNGAGKTTLLTLLAAIQKPTTGKIKLNNYELPKHQKKVRDLIGYVPQEIALWEHLTVKENMLFFRGLANQQLSEVELVELCNRVQLQGKWNEKVSKLSGGMKRKLNIAVALIHNPEIILMDEPTVGIDIQSKIEINSFIEELVTQQGKTVVYSTHDVNEIVNFCNRVGILKDGALCYSGTIPDARQGMMATHEKIMTDEEVIYSLLQS